jgi:hypothetical protein
MRDPLTGNNRAMTMHLDPDPESRSLVQPEGVNAGSDRSTAEGGAGVRSAADRYDETTAGPTEEHDAAPRPVAPDYDDTATRPVDADDAPGSSPVAGDGQNISAPAMRVGGGHPPRPADGDAEVAEVGGDDPASTYPAESGQDNGSMS